MSWEFYLMTPVLIESLPIVNLKERRSEGEELNEFEYDSI